MPTTTTLRSPHKYVLHTKLKQVSNTVINTVVWLDPIGIDSGVNADREFRVNMTTSRLSMAFLRLNSSREDKMLCATAWSLRIAL